ADARSNRAGFCDRSANSFDRRCDLVGGSDLEVTMSKIGQCNCLVGTAVIDSDGNCRCINTVPTTTRGPVPPLANRTKGQANYYVMTAPAPAGSEMTILGFPAIYVIGAAALGFWFFTSNGR